MESTTTHQKKKRASAPRVRTGCTTCKIRRLKCDEGKPFCNRCIRFGVKCDGYGHNKLRPIPRPNPVTSRLIVAKAPSICASPSQNLFNKPEEWSYFQRFCTYTVEHLTGLRGSELWNRVVLQATQSDPSIRAAATAIGALDFKDFSAYGDRDEFIKCRKQFAYKEYQKAIVGIRKTLAAKDCDIRTRLIACILFACFEAYHGNFDSSVAQIFAGVEMLEEHQKQKRLSMQAHNTARLESVDDEFLHAFAQLEIQVCAWGDNRSKELHLERSRNCAAALENMPFQFKTIKQASYALSVNMLWGIHLSLPQVPHAFTGDVPPVVTLNGAFSGPKLPEGSERELLSTFKKWSEAFEPLWRKSRSAEGKHILQGATLLRSHYLGSFLWCAASSPHRHLYYKQYTRELAETVALCKKLIEMSIFEKETIFTFDMWVVLPLSVVGLNYRHRALRREAISILKNLVRREGTWDAPMMGKVMEWMADKEEEGLGDEEYVPEDGIANICALDVNEPNRTVFVRCSKGVRGQPGMEEILQTTLSW